MPDGRCRDATDSLVRKLCQHPEEPSEGSVIQKGGPRPAHVVAVLARASPRRREKDVSRIDRAQIFAFDDSKLGERRVERRGLVRCEHALATLPGEAEIP